MAKVMKFDGLESLTCSLSGNVLHPIQYYQYSKRMAIFIDLKVAKTANEPQLNSPDRLLHQTTPIMITATARMTTTNTTTTIPAIAPVLSPVFGAPGGGKSENITNIDITYACVFENLISLCCKCAVLVT